MVILGIDPGTATTGYGLINNDNGNISLITYGCIKTPVNETRHIRLKYIYNDLLNLMEEYDPEVLVIEKLFFNKNIKTALSVGESRGIVLLAGAVKNLPVFEYTPLQVKYSLTGYGRADKNQIKELVKLTLKIEEKISSDDAADALAIALCHIAEQNISNGEK